MRTIETPRTIPETPAYEVTDTSYECEGCDFTSTDEDAMKEHERQKHTFTSERTIGKYTYRYFVTHADFTKFCEALGGDQRWEERGWYRFWTKWHSCTSCYASGCGWESEECEKADAYIRELRKKAAALEEEAVLLEDHDLDVP